MYFCNFILFFLNQLKFFNFEVIKLYGWEIGFKQMVDKIRCNELEYLKKIGHLNIVSSL